MSKGKRKNPHAVELGRRGGKAAAGAGARVRWGKLSAEERTKLMRHAAQSRWSKTKKKRARKPAP